MEYGGYRSDCHFGTSGIPQGSNLGPFLLILFIDDLSIKSSNLHSYDLLFADDVNIYFEIRCFDDCLRLQETLNDVVEWNNNNYLQLNIKGCKTLSFHRKACHLKFDCTINNIIIERCDRCKNLGIPCDRTLTFDDHISSSHTSFSNDNALKLLHVTFTSKLEYASLINMDAHLYFESPRVEFFSF